MKPAITTTLAPVCLRISRAGASVPDNSSGLLVPSITERLYMCYQTFKVRRVYKMPHSIKKLYFSEESFIAKSR